MEDRSAELRKWWARARRSVREWQRSKGADREKARALAALDVWLVARAEAGDNVTQRTAPWYERRHAAVGGSQLGRLRGLSKWGPPWQTVEDLAGEGGGRRWMAAAAWGTILEPLSTMILEALGAECRETGALWGRVPGHSNSPDGVAWLEAGRLGRFLRTVTDAEGVCHEVPGGLAADDPRAAGALRLLEFKSAFSRVLEGAAPPCAEHMTQLAAGLDTVPFARDGLLLNTVSRRCRLRDWRVAPGFNPQSIAGRDETYPSQAAMPEALGVVVFHFGPPGGKGLSGAPASWPRAEGGKKGGYPPLPEDASSPMRRDPFYFKKSVWEPLTMADRYSASRLRLIWLRTLASGVLDLGEATPQVASEVIWMAQNGLLWMSYACVVVADPESDDDPLELPATQRLELLASAGASEATAVAVLPVKVLVIEGHLADRPARSVTEEMRPRIWAAIECARALREGAPRDEVRERFEDYLSGRASPPHPPLVAAARLLHPPPGKAKK